MGTDRIGLASLSIDSQGTGSDRSVWERKGMEGILQTVYPIDTSTLHKGDLIPMSQLVEITKAQPGTSRYAFKLLKLKQFISRAMAMRGEPATVVIRKSELVILTDAEANEYNFAFAGSGARRIRRSA